MHFSLVALMTELSITCSTSTFIPLAIAKFSITLSLLTEETCVLGCRSGRYEVMPYSRSW